jgi:hypothetical protein
MGSYPLLDPEAGAQNPGLTRPSHAGRAQGQLQWLDR